MLERNVKNDKQAETKSVLPMLNFIITKNNDRLVFQLQNYDLSSCQTIVDVD